MSRRWDLNLEELKETRIIKVRPKFPTLKLSISLKRMFLLRKLTSQTLKELVSKLSSVWIIQDGIKPTTWHHARCKNTAEWFSLSFVNHHHVDCCCWWGKFPEQAEAIFSKGKWVLFWISFSSPLQTMLTSQPWSAHRQPSGPQLLYSSGNSSRNSPRTPLASCK